MTAKSLRFVYVIISIIISFFLLRYAYNYFDITPKWWLSFLVYFVFYFIGRFFYTYFSGVNVQGTKINYDNSKEFKSFEIVLLLGINKSVRVRGQFNKNIDISEKELESVIYKQTTRSQLKPAINANDDSSLNAMAKYKKLKRAGKVEMTYSLKGESFKVLFY